MNYWVYKCNSRGEAVGNNQWGDWEDEYALGGDGRAFDWGNISYIPDLARPKKGDRVIAHQSDRHKLVGVAEVVGLRRNGEFRLKPLERIGADVRALKKRHAAVASIPAYQGGPIRTIYDISRADAERLLRLARESVRSSGSSNGRKRTRQRLATVLDEVAAAEEASAGMKGSNAWSQGFGLTPKERRAVEIRAVALAIEHFESDGWSVENVGDRESFDLVCRRKGKELHVEVKGTTGLGQKVILPRNEVQHARSYKHVALVVVHGMKLKRGKVPKVSGGKLLVRHPWKIAEKSLDPVAYYYDVA
jgi:hypothetical protein